MQEIWLSLRYVDVQILFLKIIAHTMYMHLLQRRKKKEEKATI